MTTFAVDRQADGSLNNSTNREGEEYIVLSDSRGGIAALIIPHEDFPDPKDAPVGAYPLLDALRNAGVLGGIEGE